MYFVQSYIVDVVFTLSYQCLNTNYHGYNQSRHIFLSWLALLDLSAFSDNWNSIQSVSMQ